MTNPRMREMVQMRAGELVKHQSGKAWGHQSFQVFLKGDARSLLRQKKLPSEQDSFRQGVLFWGTVAWVPPEEVGPDDFFV